VDFRQHQVAGQLHVADGVDLALANVGGNEDVLFVGADRDLGRLDGEVHVAAIEIKGPQHLEVAGELLPRVLVAPAPEHQTARGVGLEVIAQFLVAERLVADDVDVADACLAPS
jgi:hypothetical protein